MSRVKAFDGVFEMPVPGRTVKPRKEGLTMIIDKGLGLAATQDLLERSIVAIGNAPTALYEVIRLVEEGVRPALIVGVPVGFVSTVESKTALTQVTAVPWIVTLGRKGGSPVAVAIVNALLRLASGASATEID